jgi:hypothetical protein
MSSFLDRSNYLKKVAHFNKAIAHERDIESGGKRNSFHRVNDEEELLSACVNWGHFPCVAHIGYDGGFKDDQIGTPKNMMGTHLWFLSSLDNDAYPNKADAIEHANDESFAVMMEYLSFMREDREKHGATGYLFNFDLNNAKYDQLAGIASKLYGWYLKFTDSKPERALIFDSSKWYQGVDEEVL